MATGVGLLLPFKRDGRGDFATGRDNELIRSEVRLVLGTRGDSPLAVGELPWRTSFGARLDALRFLPLDQATLGLAESMCREAFKQWLPALIFVGVRGSRDGERLLLHVSYRKRSGSETYTERIVI